MIYCTLLSLLGYGELLLDNCQICKANDTGMRTECEIKHSMLLFTELLINEYHKYNPEGALSSVEFPFRGTRKIKRHQCLSSECVWKPIKSKQ